MEEAIVGRFLTFAGSRQEKKCGCSKGQSREKSPAEGKTERKTEGDAYT